METKQHHSNHTVALQRMNIAHKVPQATTTHSKQWKIILFTWVAAACGVQDNTQSKHPGLT